MATVLVVDDSANNRALLARILQQGDHRVLEASNGAEALGLALTRRPDVVMTDVLMPKVDGYELERHLRTDPRTSTIPVILQTAAYDRREVIAMVEESPRRRILPKPADVVEILDAVASLATLTDSHDEDLGPPDEGEHLALLNDKLLQTVRELEAAGRERQQLLAHLIRAQEDERASIAGDIHDDSVQAMTAVAMRLELLGRQLQDHALVERHRELQDTVRSAIARLRRLLFQLHPPALEREGLATAITDYLEHATVAPHHDVVDQLKDEPPVAMRTLLYRVVQEALVNVAKHADAKSVRVELSSEEGGSAVAVHDDGRGFAPNRVVDRPGHMGLASMRQRVEVAGGRLVVDSAAGRGTSVRVWMPASTGEEEA